MPLLQIDASTDVTLAWRIDASRARVWECLTEAGLVGQWLGEVVEGAIRDGADFVVDQGDNSCCQSTVTRYEERYRLDFTWDFPEEPESTVAFQLGGSGSVTELRLRHTSLADLAASYRDGWCVHLSYLEGAAIGAPLPRAMFWPLHGTIARLNAF
jgi:uncharacterized protein YndB with AHSA1/START domain